MKNLFIPTAAGAFALASLSAACASEPGYASKQDLIDAYRSSPISSEQEAQSVREAVLTAALMSCPRRGPRSDLALRLRRVCMRSFVSDVVTEIESPALNAAFDTGFIKNKSLNDETCAASGRNKFVPGPRKSPSRRKTCAGASR